ncbi:predicted protein [Streptomyces viridochromogenes DSM 40736]|uniref:Predicted protein n=1 Tax=Streptomyces viridochromogenes (strain DSM 40736 / JCM 4977 / BCRC 1201 / Tue 494) TaxID=591159 RepID=D9X468_STRVT|nr:predicted protein [Streptomyces viridochromogenes DSM 40736]
MISGCRRTGLANVNRRPRGPEGPWGPRPAGGRPRTGRAVCSSPAGSADFGEVPLSDRDEGHIVVEVRLDELSGSCPFSA